MKFIFSLSILIVCIGQANSQCNVNAFYQLNGNALDGSGNSMNGTNSGSLATTDRFGNLNSAMAFDGSNDQIALPDDFDYNNTTINIWFKAESSGSLAKTIYDNDKPGLANGARKMYVQNNGAIPSIYFNTGASTTNMFSVPITLNTWYMATIVVDANVRYYLNGALVATYALNSSNTSSGSPVAHIGCTRLIDRFFDGDIDDVSIYDCALNQQSIDSLFNLNFQASCIVANYDLNGVATDNAGNSFHGINNGASPAMNRFNNSNSAMMFDGGSNYIELPNDFDYIERSINIWFNAESSSTQAKTIYDSDHPGLVNASTKLYVMESGGFPSICFSTGSGSTNFFAEPINLNQWYMATIVVGADVKFYLDGQLINTYSLNPGNSTGGNSNALIGCTRLIDRFFDGRIDDVSIYDCDISQSEIDSLFDNFVNQPPPTPTNCIISSFELNDSGVDSIGINHGNVNGAVGTFDRFGNPNSAMAFDGINDRIEFPQDFDFTNTTINIWFKAESSSSSPKTIFDNDHPGLLNGSRKMYVMNNGGTPSVYFSTGAGTTNVYSVPITMNTWYMATLVVDSNVRYYLNGVLVATFALHGSNSTSGSLFAHLGCTRLIDRFFDGDIDDVSIYDCSLSNFQIDSLYDNYVPVVINNCLMGDYYFSGNANDLSGNGNDGITNDVVLTSDLFGNSNSAFSFNDSTSYIDLNSDFDFPSRTVNLWFKANDIDTTVQHLYDSDHPLLNNGSTKMWLIEDSIGTRIGYSTGNGGVNGHFENVNENQWYMSSISVSPTQVTYYLNGQPIQTDVFNAGSSTSGYDQALLGTSRLFDRYFDGDIDNVSIYQCEMSATFIDSLFQLGSAAIQPAFCDLLASSTITSPNCFGNATAGIDLVVTSNIGPVSYAWNNGTSASGLYNISAGNYSVFITDTIGCDTTINFTINNPNEILITSTVVEPSCNSSEGEIDIAVSNAASPYDISWSTGDTTSLTDSIPAGLYYVEIIDANGCQGSLGVSLNNSNSMSITDTIISNTVCPYGNTGFIDISLTGGAAPLTYSWSNGSTNEDVSNLSTGLYDVIITDDNGCVLSGTFEVEAPSPFNFSFTIQPSFCNSSNGAALINVSGATAPYSYQWITGATTSSVSGLPVGYYSVTVTDDNGCSFTDIAIINEFGGPQIATDTLIQPSCGGNDGQVEISVYAGVPPFTYDWSDNSTAQDLIGVSNGTYSVIVTGSNGCSSVNVFDLEGTTPDSIEICIISVDSLTQRNLIIWEKPVTTDIDHFNIYKETSTANVFNLVGSVDYDSLSVFLDSTANPQVRGWRYKLTAVDLCGNESMQSQFHKTLHLNANIGVGGVINLDWDEYTGFPYGTFYIWRYHPSTDWIIIDSIPSNLFAYTDIGGPSGNVDYYIEVRKSSGCDPTRSGEVSSRSNTRTQNSTGNSIDENQNDLLKIYPNPTIDLLFIELTSGKVNARYEIMDVAGKLVYSGTLLNQPINVKELSRGLYTINVILENENYIQKFIKN